MEISDLKLKRLKKNVKFYWFLPVQHKVSLFCTDGWANMLNKSCYIFVLNLNSGKIDLQCLLLQEFLSNRNSSLCKNQWILNSKCRITIKLKYIIPQHYIQSSNKYFFESNAAYLQSQVCLEWRTVSDQVESSLPDQNQLFLFGNYGDQPALYFQAIGQI